MRDTILKMFKYIKFWSFLDKPNNLRLELCDKALTRITFRLHSANLILNYFLLNRNPVMSITWSIQ